MSLLSILAALFLVIDKSPQQDLVDASPETNSPIDFHDRYTEVKLLSQGLVLVDIDTLYLETVPFKDLPGLLTKVAVLARVEYCFLCHASHGRIGNKQMRFWILRHHSIPVNRESFHAIRADHGRIVLLVRLLVGASPWLKCESDISWSW